MADNDKPLLTPKLRFPAFGKDGGWKPTPLSDVCARIVEKVGDVRLTPVSITAGRGYVSQAEKFGRDISGAQYKNYIHLRRGDFAYNRGNSNLYPQGCVYRLKEFDEAAASNAFICFKLLDGNAAGFFEGLFEKNTHGNQLTRFLTSGARSDGLLNIKPEEFFSVEFPLPPLVAEQQKIADCLTSLDDVIAAQGRRVEALAAHKKGLMQQLFPREGETLPRLRFPEFRDAGEWRVLPLAELADKIMVGIASAATHAYRETGVPMLRNQNIKEGKIDDSSLLFIDPAYETAHKNKRLKAGDVITVRTGYPGLSAVVTERYHNSQCFTSLITRPKKTLLRADYLCVLINSDLGKRFILGAEAGGAQKNVNAGALEALPVCLPNLAEQQRIADCLASLDARLAAEAEKLAALKTHKKGLMQQLFPSATSAGQGQTTEAFVMRYGDRHVTAADADTAETIEPPAMRSRKPYTIGFARQLLAAEILHHCHAQPTMGRVKLQKLIHLCEYHAELDDIHGNYDRAAAGPFDNKLMRGVAAGLERQKWFKEVRGEKGSSYEPMPLNGRHVKYLKRWDQQLPKIHEVIRLFANAKTLSCEIASTLYAVWNDLLIDGQQPTDEEIISEASDPKRWHESKAKIEASKWPTALKWMRKNGLVPRGYGAHTRKQGG